MPKECGDKPRNPSRNQERMMEQDAKKVGDKPRNPSRNQEMMMEQSLFLGRIENPIQLQSCLGKNQMHVQYKSI